MKPGDARVTPRIGDGDDGAENHVQGGGARRRGRRTLRQETQAQRRRRAVERPELGGSVQAARPTAPAGGAVRVGGAAHGRRAPRPAERWISRVRGRRSARSRSPRRRPCPNDPRAATTSSSTTTSEISGTTWRTFSSLGRDTICTRPSSSGSRCHSARCSRRSGRWAGTPRYASRSSGCACAGKPRAAKTSAAKPQLPSPCVKTTKKPECSSGKDTSTGRPCRKTRRRTQTRGRNSQL